VRCAAEQSRELTIDDLGNVNLHQETEQQGDTIDTLVDQLQGGVHVRTPAKSRGESPVATRSTAGLEDRYRLIKYNYIKYY
jgi:hypothetical protein